MYKKDRRASVHATEGSVSDGAKARYIDLKSDFGFKKVFGSPVHEEFLVDLVNCLLPDRRAKSIKYLNTENLGLSRESKETVFDVQCTSDDGSVFIVEMQRKGQKTFRERTLYYSTFTIQEQMMRGDEDYVIPPIYVISILDFKLPHAPVAKSEKNAYLVSSYSLRNDWVHEDVMTDRLRFIYLELGRFSKCEGELETNLDRWCYVLKGIEALRERPLPFQRDIFRRLFDVAEVEHLSMRERIQYEKDMTTERDLRNQMAYAKEMAEREGRAAGHAAGHAEGHAAGHAEGHAEGHAAGLLEGQKRIAENLRAMGLTEEQIAKATEL